MNSFSTSAYKGSNDDSFIDLTAEKILQTRITIQPNINCFLMNGLSTSTDKG